MGGLFQYKPNAKVQYNGKLQNLGKVLFLKLAAPFVSVVKQTRDTKGIFFGIKSIITV